MNSGKFFRLIADPAAGSRWFLSAPVSSAGQEIDPRAFTQGLSVGAQPAMTIALRRPGQEVLFNFCDFDMVVTPASLNQALETLVGRAIQRFPIGVANASTELEILNVCELVTCIDEEKSLGTRWGADDGRPEKLGQHRMILKLHIDPVAASGRQIFRVAGWPIALVISEEVKKLFEARGVTGVAYQPVT